MREHPRPQAPSGTAPPAASSLLGRTEQLSELEGALEHDRLVTLSGAPGIGKSRLALELAQRGGARPAGGAGVVELAPLARAADVPRAIASALAVDEVAGERLTDTLVTRLAKRRLLLVLDNCEHLLGACGALVEALLEGCPDLRVVATSREPLGLGAERVWQVPPLPVPGADEQRSPAELARYPAVALFCEAAAAAEPGFALNPYIAPAVAEIVRRLDGIPLAIELAAARVESLTPAEIARRLDDRFALLTRAATAEPARHDTLAASLDWSHALLSAPERALLRRLSVFAGGFDPEAVQAVCVGGEVEREEVSELLGRLTSKSLVVAGTTEAPQTRYHLLETIRAYVAERLEAADEASVLRRVHVRFYLKLAERAEPELTGPEQERWLERLAAERANLRAALEWSLGHGEADWALRLTGALVLFWRVRCHFSEGRELLEAAVAAGERAPCALRAKARWGGGFMALMLGEIDAAVSSLDQSLAAFRECGDLRGSARTLLLLGNCHQYLAGERALSLLDESAALARQAGDPWCLAHALGVAGLDHGSRDDLSAARPLFEECLTVAREAQDKQGLRLGLFGLGSVALRQGDFPLAESVLREAADLTTELGEDYSHATALQYLGQLAGERGDYARARELLGAALALFRETGPPHAPIDALACLADVHYGEGDRRSARVLFEQALALARGRGWSPAHALRGMGQLAADDGKPDVARRLFEEALELARGRGDKSATARALHALGQLARDEGELRRAAALEHEALQLQREIGSAPGIVASLEAVAGVAAAAGRYSHAARLLGAANARRDECGYARPPSASTRYEPDMALVRKGLSRKEFDAAFIQGAGLPLEEAVAQAAESPRGRERHSDGWPSLTASERDVAALVAEGLTNPQIAERLFVSRGTVKFHLSNIFRKLEMAGRMELAQEAWRQRQDPGDGDG